jgi:6-phosphofructokinase 2
MKSIVSMTLNPAIDKSSSVAHVVAERKLYCAMPRFDPGGGGVNVARAIKKLGGESTLFYPIGGMTGEKLRELLDEEGLTQHPLPISGSVRENFAVLEEATGLQYRFSMPGPELSEAEWGRFLTELSAFLPSPDYVVLSGSLPPGAPDDFYARAARIAKGLGAKPIVDAAGAALKAAIQEGVYMIKPNIGEFLEVIGEELKEESQIIAQAQRMIGEGRCEVMAISLGTAGALLVTEEQAERIPAPTVPIISKVGAGDSMVAGIVLSLARGKALREAVMFGVAAGSAAVMRAGTGLCRKDDAERLFATMTTPGKSGL